MKIMDEKGKLFGVINIIDLAVLLVIFAVFIAAASRLVSSRSNAGGESPLAPEEDLYVTLYSSAVIPEIVTELKVGDHLVANNKVTDAEIVSITSKPADYIAADQNGKPVLSKNPLWKDVIVVIKDKAKKSDVILKAGEQEVRTNYSFILKTQTVEVNSKIRGVAFGEAPQTLINGVDGNQVYDPAAETTTRAVVNQ